MAPDFVSHYYLPDRRPFLNLSDLDDASIAAVDREMAALRAAGRQFRPFGPRYMEWRRLTERRLRELFIDRGGKPERTAPHYFVLGGSRWFEGLAVGMQTITIPVASLPPAVTSVTLPDSFTAMGFGARFGLPTEAKPYHGHVFLPDEIDDVIAEFGMPTASWDQRHEDWRKWPETAYVEVQVWSDEPLRDYLKPDDTVVPSTGTRTRAEVPIWRPGLDEGPVVLLRDYVPF